MGYVVMTNYSFNGKPYKGQGYSRYITASNLFYNAALQDKLSVEFILREAERNLVNGFTKTDLTELATTENEVKMVHFRDNITRRTSTSSAIFKGVAPGNDPAGTMMWAVGGWPAATIAYPVWLNDEHVLPGLLTAPRGQNSEMCDLALRMKLESMPIQQGHGKDYININKLWNREGSGYLQWIRPLEDRIINLTKTITGKNQKPAPESKKIKELYNEIDELLISTYKNHGYKF